MSGCVTASSQALGLRWWRGQLGWVPQDILLFNRTIAENIAYGCHDSIDHTQIEKAAITANIHSFITSLPEVTFDHVTCHMIHATLILCHAPGVQDGGGFPW